MPRQFIEKEAIVDVAYAIAQADGLKAVNIRSVATACGVAVGSIYNYFPTKDDLVAAVVERFFGDAFFENFCHPSADEDFLAYCERLFASMQETLSRFRGDWLAQIQSMGTGARDAAKKLEADRLVHVRQGLEHVLIADKNVRPDALSDGLDAPALCSFVLQSMLGALRSGDDCAVLFQLIQRSLY